MADDQIPGLDEPPPPLNELVNAHVDQLFEPKNLSRLQTILANALQAALATVLGIVLSLAAKIGAFLARSIADAEDKVGPEFNQLASAAIKDMFGIDAPALDVRRGSGGNVAAADAIGAALLQAFSGQARGGAAASGPLEPSDEPAKVFLSAMAQLALEGWLEGWIVEAFSLGQLETFGDLDDTISHVLGLGRASAAVHGPLVNHLITTPLDWKISKDHRPTLLTAASAIRQFTRGRWDWDAVVEELARQGYSDERIDALKNEQRKFLSVGDVALISGRVDTATFDPIAYLNEAGYDTIDAKDQLLAESARQLDAQEKQYAAAAIAAFARGDIGATEFDRAIDSIKLPADVAAHYKRLGELQASFQRKRLTGEQAARLVLADILAFADYRAALEREGYPPNDVAALELELRQRKDAARALDAHRAQQAIDAAATKAAADAARAARLAAIAAADAQPALADVRRAFVRGFVPIDRYRAAVITAHPGIADPDVAALLADAQQDRDEYVANVAKRDAAIARDADPALPLAVLEASTVQGITTIDTYDRELARRGYDDAERAVFVALVQGRIDDERERQAARTRAAAKAATAGISIADFERAVRLGVRTLDDYTAILERLDVPDVERAVLVDLLRADLAADRQAAAKRAALDAAAKQRAIDLPLRRRAVLAGALSRDAYTHALTAAGVTVDEQAIELALLDLEVAHTHDARAAALPLRRRAVVAGVLDRDDYAAALAAAGVPDDQAAIDLALLDHELTTRPPATAPGPTLTLAQVEAAVAIGVLVPDDLRAYLHDRGYGDADADTLVALVVAKLPDARAADTTRATVAGELAAKGVSLAQLEDSVLRGVTSLDAYAAALTDRGYGVDAVTLLRQLLAERVAVRLDAVRKKIAAALAPIDGAPTIDEFDAAVRDGTVTPATARGYLAQLGIDRDAAIVYVRLVSTVAPGDRP